MYKTKLDRLSPEVDALFSASERRKQNIGEEISIYALEDLIADEEKDVKTKHVSK